MISPAPKLGYHSALDGVRALAIILVMASHAHPTALKGGSLGVDVFFAMSGFLITTLILEELRAVKGGYGYRRFYVRRALRLFPALYATVAIVALYLVLRRDHLPQFLHDAAVDTPYPWTTWAKFVVGSATYTSNLIGVTATPGNLLGHTWSLALEEQFYLLWPLALVSMWRRGAIKALMGVVVAFIGVCLVCRLAGAPTGNGFLWMRPEAIAAGALMAMARWQFPAARAAIARASSVILYLGAPIIVGVALARNHGLPASVLDRGLFPFYGLLAALVVWALVESDEHQPVRRMFELRPAVYIGTISYGLYIWHLPIFRIVSWEFTGLGGTVNIAVKVALSVFVAVLSARFVERPFRRMQNRFRSTPTPSDQ